MDVYRSLELAVVFEMVDELHQRILDALASNVSHREHMERLFKVDSMFHTLEEELQSAPRWVLTEKGVQALKAAEAEGRHGEVP